MANNRLKVNIDADTSEALKQMKVVTEAVNECVAALEKLEQVMGRFTNKNNSIEIEVPVLLNRKQIAEAITNVKKSELIQKINDSKLMGMDSKVSISLDGKVILESIVEQTTDGFKITATDIKGVK
ncbi:hypothetical protein ACQKF0_09410 [Bacillus wiedmannii]|uniref:hypothetical protein n=1 Tax=Bacillus wiedmannii TaxID=1890302 RepID=UPI003CEE2C27